MRLSTMRASGLGRQGHARILRELIDVAIGCPEVHPGIAALVRLGQENLNVGSHQLLRSRLDVVDKEAQYTTALFLVFLVIAVWALRFPKRLVT